MTMNKIKFIFASALAVAAVSSCLKEEAMVIQKPYTYDEQYFENIREFKKSEHTLSYAYYAAWAPLEGSTGYKEPASWGERIIGLPDSLDIVNLWMNYPSPDPENENYSPIAYADMKYAQETLGTRFVLHGDAASTRDVVYQGDTTNIHDAYNAWKRGDESARITLYAGLDKHIQLMVDKVVDAGLDGVDVDWEPNIPVWQDHETILYVMENLNKKLKAIDPDMLCILDVFGDVPPTGMNGHIDYLVVQRYSHQRGRRVSQLDEAWTVFGEGPGIPKEKFIVCETAGTGNYHLDGGGLWLDAQGNQLYTNDGSEMYSFEGFARWASENEMGGWGVFYVGRSYYATGGPYYDFRRAIQIANPTIY